MSFFNHKTVRTKLLMTALVPFIGILSLLITTLYIMDEINQGVDRIYRDRVLPLERLKIIADNYAVRVIDAVNKANAGLYTAEQSLQQIGKAKRIIGENWALYKTTDLDVEEARLATEANVLFKRANIAIENTEKTLATFFDRVKGQLNDIDGPLYHEIDPISDKISELIEYQLVVAKAEREGIHSWYQESIAGFIIGGLVIFMMLLALRVMISSSVILPLSLLRNTMENIAKNSDLTLKTDIDSKDEIGDMALAFDTMLSRINQLILGITGATEQIATAAEEMSAVSIQANQNSRQQQVETERASAAIAQMTASVLDVEQHARDTNDATLKANVQAKGGYQAVQRTLADINALMTIVQQASVATNKLEDDTQSIGVVLDVIKGIADQTNLLALNAAIEAARAGEFGRGFSVVANEVRNLAQKTQQSTKEIEQVIERLQFGTQYVVQVMGSSEASAGECVRQAKEASLALTDITGSVAEIATMNGQIVAGAHQQSQSSDDISLHILLINELASQTSQGAEQIEQASADLSQLASGLQGMVNIFKVV